MSDMGLADPGGQVDMQMAAAALLADNKDVKMMLRVLGKTMQDAFGDRVEVTHPSGGLLHHQSEEIKSITVHLGPERGAADRAMAGPAPGCSAKGSCQQPERAGGSRERDYRRTHMSNVPSDLPKDAGARLQELEHGLFTSDLSVNEFLLVKQVGFHPLGLVMGSSIYHIGLQKGNWGSSQELTKLTAAMYNARELAMNRMEEEADQLGADGVVGVRLDVNFYEWGHDSAEFIAVGTAVKAEDGNSYRNKLGKPFTSDLSGQDFWTLAQTGYMPQALVMGTCVYHIAHRGIGQALGQLGQNAELENFTQAMYDARELAMKRMQDEANNVGATGVVGMRLEEKSHQWGEHTIEFLSLGTAVARRAGSDGVAPPRPTTIITFDN
jgi:uncharacterized protein YbjQ (UPF0145 family)